MNGHVGIFTPNPKKRKTLIKLLLELDFKEKKKDSIPKSEITLDSLKNKKIPINKKKLPNKVHTNISLIASPILSDFEVNFKIFIETRSNDSNNKNITTKDLLKIKRRLNSKRNIIFK
jgi:hypothetical protein